MLSSNGTDQTGLAWVADFFVAPRRGFLGGLAPASFCGSCPGDVPVAAGAAD